MQAQRSSATLEVIDPMCYPLSSYADHYEFSLIMGFGFFVR